MLPWGGRHGPAEIPRRPTLQRSKDADRSSARLISTLPEAALNAGLATPPISVSSGCASTDGNNLQHDR
jgi:hypothetical protein